MENKTLLPFNFPSLTIYKHLTAIKYALARIWS
jgi:hypothetical protein